MPLNVRGWFISVLAIICSFIIPAAAQNAANVPVPSPITAPQQQPTSGDIMRDRISKAKAFIAVRNYNAAIYELENIRREFNDPAVGTVTNVLLMTSFLEQGDFKRAQGLLNDLYTKQKTDTVAAANYKAVAAQVNNSARVRAERYRALGLSVADRTLPLEALTDLEKMRETLEIVVTQSNELAKDPKRAGDAMALIEEAGTSRSMLARDDFDSRRWRDTVSDTREAMMNPSNKVLDAVSGPPVVELAVASQPASTTVSSVQSPKAVDPPTADRQVVSVPITREREVKIPATVAATAPAVEKKAAPVAKAEPVVPAETPVVKAENLEPMVIGSLINYATRQPQPVYPPAARSIRATGVVRVEVMVDEKGEVAEVQKATGPSLLQAAAKDAILKWRFRPFVRDGQPVKATGFVSFSFK